MRNGRDLGRGLGGLDVAEVDPGQLLPVEPPAELDEAMGLVDEAEELRPGGAQAGVGGGEVSHRQRIAGEGASLQAGLALAHLAGDLVQRSAAMPRGTAASIGRMMLNTGICQSGASGHASPTKMQQCSGSTSR